MTSEKPMSKDWLCFHSFSLHMKTEQLGAILLFFKSYTLVIHSKIVYESGDDPFISHRKHEALKILYKTPNPQKLATVSYHRGYDSCLSRSTHTLLQSQKKMFLKQTLPLPPTSFAQSSNLVKIFWNLQSNLFLCGWPILLCLVLTTMTPNWGNKMMGN